MRDRVKGRRVVRGLGRAFLYLSIYLVGKAGRT